MKRSRIYTRGGDTGQTSLIGARRVSKADSRIEAYGTVDELNCHLGLVRSALQPPLKDELAPIITSIQSDLFTVGAILASTEDNQSYASALSDRHVGQLESWIDAFDARLEPLRAFILPGGSWAGALLHVSRAVCRRAERRVVALSSQSEVPAAVLAYLNRLSDLLFVLARYANAQQGVPEQEWEGLARNRSTSS